MLEMFCSRAFRHYLTALVTGAPQEEIDAAENVYEACMKQFAPSSAHAVINQMEMLHACMAAGGSMWECLGFLTSKPDLPGTLPTPIIERTDELGRTIFENPDNALAVSKSLQAALKDIGVELADDETFVCTLQIAKKPAYVSDVLASGGHAATAGKPRINFIMRPSVMKSVMRAVEQDKIK